MLSGLASGFLNYEAKQGHLPPAVVYGADGRPLHSWRVLLLPYIEQDALYNEFHLDEPWDSPHNLGLLPRMPSSYAPPGNKQKLAPPHHTFCHVLVGKGAAFEGADGLSLQRDFPDGISNTLLIVEGGPAVPWTKPEEIVFEAGRPLPELATVFKDGCRACCVDGSLTFIPRKMEDKNLRALITRNGGETIPWPLP